MSDPTPAAAPSQSPQQRTVITPGAAKEARRPNLVIIGLLLMAVTGFGFWLVVQSLDNRQQYVVAARTIEPWERLATADLTVVEADIGTASGTTSAQASALLGNWAMGRVPAGTLITPGMFAPPPLSSESEASRVVVQISLPANEVAFGTLESGDTVALIGREASPAAAFGSVDEFGDPTGFGAEPQSERDLIGILRLEVVQGGCIFYIVEPDVAVRIENLVERYLTASDRTMWKIGLDVQEEDIRQALGTSSGNAAGADSGTVVLGGGDASAGDG